MAEATEMGREISANLGTLGERLRAYAEEVRGESPEISVGRRLAGGWSVDTFHVDWDSESLVLRIATDEHPLRTSPAREARIFPRATAAGVPAPRLFLAEDDPAWLGGPFSLVEHVRGIVPNVWSPSRMRALLTGTTAYKLLENMVELTLRIPEMPLEECTKEPPSILGLRREEYAIVSDVERWAAMLDDAVRPRPVLAAAARWLVDNAPPTERVVFQHHDFRLGNILFAENGAVNAVLDWEFAGAGDPLCDLGYAAQPYTLGRLLSSPSSLGTLADPTATLLEMYAERSEHPVDPERMRYFVILGAFKMAVALAVTAEEWWSGRGGRRDQWLELPILSLSDDLVDEIRRIA